MSSLTGVKVLDLSKVLAGPLCTQSLGDMGATVIKVEPLNLGDDTRGWPPFRAEGLGAVFLSVNRNKRSIALDLKTPTGREVVHRLAVTADVAVESYGAGVAERLGVDAATLTALNQRLVHCSISGYGRFGPLKNLPGYDVVLQAFSGMMSLTGEEGGGYIRSPISPVDQVTGLNALTGILAGLFERVSTGRGTTVNVSLFETALGLLRYNFQSFWEQGVQPPRCGSTHEALAPYRVFESADGPILVAVANDRIWQKFCTVAGLEDSVDDPRFRTSADRAANRAQTDEVVQRVIAQRSASYWNDELTRAGVPCSPVNTLKEVIDHPHTEASGMVLDYDHPSGGPVKAIALPLSIGAADRVAGTPPPLHGEHTLEILDDLGYSATDIDEMRAAGTIL